jgi:autotransporter-associated beta strand protein
LGQELIADRQWQRGATVWAPLASNGQGVVEGSLQSTTNNGTPLWILGQWYTRQTIYGASPVVLASGATRWTNLYKQVTMGSIGTDDSDAILRCDGIAEWNGVWRKSGDVWPHLQLQMGIADPGTGGAKNYAPRLSDLDELRIYMDVRLNSVSNQYGSGYNSSLHAAQFVPTLFIQNLKGSGYPGWGDYYYFNMMLYDDRYPKPGIYQNYDAATGKYIYDIGIPFTDSGLTVGQWKTISGNLLPHIIQGFNAARSAGALPDSGNLDDYKIGTFAMGWEITGHTRGEMQIRNLSLMFAPKGWTLGSNAVALTATQSNPSFPVWYTNVGNSASLVTRISLPLAGTNGFRKTGPGLLMLDAAEHSISGAVTVSEGILSISTNLAGLPKVSSITVSNGAQFLLGDFDSATVSKTLALSNAVTIRGDGVGGYGALFTRGTRNSGVYAGPVTLAGDARIGVYATIITNRFSGGIGGTGALTLRGQGTAATHTSFFMMESPCAYSGDTVLLSTSSLLTLRLYGSDFLPTNTILRLEPGNEAGGVTLQLNGFSQTLGGISSTEGAALRRVINDSATAAVLTVNDDSNRTFYGTLGGTNANQNNFSLVKRGVGTWTLAGLNTYSGGTTVSAGKLAVNQACLPDSSAVMIATGAVLQLNHSTTDTVGRLWIGGVQQLKGLWGPVGSAAQHQTSALAGAGMIYVTAGVPPDPVYYSDNFDGISSNLLNGLVPDISPGAEIWASSTNYNADGSFNTPSGSGRAYLPLSIETGKTYVISADVTVNTASNTYNWAGIAFASNNGATAALSTGSAATLALTHGGAVRAYRDGITVYNVAGYGDIETLKMVLKTYSDSTPWSVDYYRGTAFLTNYTFASTPVITRVAVGSYGTSGSAAISGKFGNFRLLVIPGAATRYQVWAAEQGMNASSSGLLTDDPDGDGVPNLLEWVLNRNPLAVNADGLPAVKMISGKPAYQFFRTMASKQEVTCIVQYKTDLMNQAVPWSDVIVGDTPPSGVSVSVQDAGNETEEVGVSFGSEKAPDGHLFMRLKAVSDQ